MRPVRMARAKVSADDTLWYSPTGSHTPGWARSLAATALWSTAGLRLTTHPR
ncbi:hypothetical protein [Streptomyces acidiscabies]|uniref:hypothetical protein n=1 Tax=Streptomyces acidiscabies TaxID=42234 RepID=UPI0015BE217B|nr:hypothetical protein [Streptomyces acidiscabies]